MNRQTWLTIVATLALAGGLRGEEPPKRKPLAGLPSAPAPHIAKIKALGNNQWLNLGQPKPDPQWGPAPGRSYTNKMAFVPDLRGAFLFGEGVHGAKGNGPRKGYYNDDLFFYDIHSHAWICVYPGTNIATVKRKLNEHQFEVTEAGEPAPIAAMVHGYEQIVYVPETKEFMFLPCPGAYWRKSLGPRRYQWLGGPDNARKVLARATFRHPFLYQVKSGKWRRPFTKTGPERIGFCGSLTWSPAIRKVLYYNRNDDFHAYDLRQDAWTHLKPDGKGPATTDYEGVTCYDSKRHQLYVFNRNRKDPFVMGIYDVKPNRWLDHTSKNQPGTPADRTYVGSNGSCAHYDTADDKVLLSLKTREGKQPGIYVYDPVSNRWTDNPVTGPRKGNNSFYDSELNAYFFFEAGDSRTTPGNIWVYRYRQTPK